MYKRTGLGFALLAVLIALCLWALDQLPVKLGIDLKGGTELTYRIDLSRVPADRRDSAVEEVKLIIDTRLDSYGLKELSIVKSGRDTLLIQVPGTNHDELTQLQRLISEAGALSFHLVSEAQWQAPEKIAEIRAAQDEYERLLVIHNENPTGVPKPKDLDRRVVKALSKDQDTIGREVVIETSEPLSVDGALLDRANPTIDDFGKNAVGFSFKSAGATKFADLTASHLNKQLAIILDNTLMQQATIQSRIAGNAILTGQFDYTEVTDICNLLNSGSLPAKPYLEGEQRIAALLGQESIADGWKSITIGFLLIVIFMAVYYKSYGWVANVCLLLNVLLIYTAIVVFQNSLSLPGLAGLLLTVGMAVDANILIFERIREERARGRPLASAVALGYNRAFVTIFDSNLTTLLTAFILFEFGTGPLKGFAVVLSIGLIFSFFSSVTVSKLILSFLLQKGLLSDVKFLQVVENPKIDFLALRKPALTISLTLIAIGLGFLLVGTTRHLGIDFNGGTRLLVNLSQGASENDIRAVIDRIQDPNGKIQFDDKQVQGVDAVDGQAAKFSIRVRAVRDEAKTGSGTESTTAAFRSLVETSLAGRLAPSSLTVDSNTATEWSATARLRGSAGKEPIASEIETFLKSRQFPVVKVESLPKEGVWMAFRITATPPPPPAPATVAEVPLNKSLLAALSDPTSGYELSDPFPEVNTIGSRVAKDMQGKVAIALLLAFAVIIFYCALRFQVKYGFAAVIALIHDAVFTLGAMAIGDVLFGSFWNLKINLPVIAAVLTIIGFSINDTIVIFDRIREILVDKKRDVDFKDVINQAVNQCLSRTILTSLTVFTVVAILLFWGGESLQGFSFAMCAGVVSGTYSTVYIAGPILMYFHSRQEKRRAEMLEAAAAK
ncbi:MAG: protein translocase subunit SecD [Planctomycetota bacterium]